MLSSVTPLFPRHTDARTFHLDLSQVSEMTSSGLTVLAIRLLKGLGSKDMNYRISYNASNYRKFKELCFLECLSNGEARQVEDLFSLKEHPISNYNDSHIIFSRPISYLGFSKSLNSRLLVREFLSDLGDDLRELEGQFLLKMHKILMILNEIAKNSADHSNADALFGLDICHYSQTHAKLCFTFGDLGPGIKSHIEQNLPVEEITRKAHFDLSQAYRLALKDGYSSRSTINNRGFGLPIIVDGATEAGISLNVFDASSMGTLSGISTDQPFSHARVRKHFRNIGQRIGFLYIGELLISFK